MRMRITVRGIRHKLVLAVSMLMTSVAIFVLLFFPNRLQLVRNPLSSRIREKQISRSA